MDNANLIGRKEAVVGAKLDAVKRRLDDLGLVWHEAQESSLEIEILGVILDGRRGEIRAKPSRSWRLCQGTTGLLRMSRVAGWQVRAVLGPSSASSGRRTTSSCPRRWASTANSRRL